MSDLVLLDAKLLAKIKGIQLTAKHMVNVVFAGEYLSAFKGRGMEFEEVREYQPGDDVRTIDWNVTARSNRIFVKRYRDERELTIIFMVDVSASSQFGTAQKFKNEIAAEITALLAYTALKNNDKVGLIIFSDHVEHYIPPKKGRGHVWNLIRDILSYKSVSKKTDFSIPLEYLNKVQKKKAITFLISDFQQEGYQDQIRVLSRRHDLISIGITDPREMNFPNIGYIELEDAETGEYYLVNTNNKIFTTQYSKNAKLLLKDRKKFFLLNGIEYIDIKTDTDYVNSIVRFFKDREKKRRVR
jgi:uncharacterized protein (DUF58 family)